ncbi:MULTISPECIES: Gfo/Idh/MocA family protein [unclassified Lentimonas]|uniref:Gfo/Idh/MocA family protein n=1 Tax=unclassified Lentimonas TaxID=2630993 RepID=UPI001320F5A9|nr:MULTISPECIES: Gfo/Idh/MocA family oxidoreductase [unclassified Lentimonas]CAA6677864.1 Myo-inositol 2-dehydrogenase (EC [Lentimonas sp. CC4]CAA6683968.1 Myo-inositol 2-dehydrogenase (EC [Lentimonas sp. CC6]CAA7076656.1 Myo-inositol 2-dehydrogenase (EC [Lentimonas sp. CC4]CAA7170016.1 Myo-inositol 2-dehydrogenase (EC [Lentimonas sp. CC21]CAA7181299.1 Myo-inositol 2-dehydrogenase (EC [Lentimonas sp. CC8]
MNNFSRRDFVKAAAVSVAAVSTFNILGAQTVNGIGTQKAKVGLIGCGGRGKGALGQFLQSCKILGIEVEVVAVADVFEDRVDGTIKRFKIDASKGYSGYESYRKVTESDAEFVIMATPPNFRPQHLEACVEAGKHCFIEKPVAVDPVGARKVIALGELAKAKGLTIIAGTQRRYDASYQMTKAKIEAGAIGDIVGGVVSWNGQVPWISSRKPDQSDAHYMTRNWLNFTELSGDHIVEQHVHQLDVANWYVGRTPVSFTGMGGRARRETGNQFDFFSVDVDYGDGVHIHSQCRQIAGCYNRVGESFRGTEGQTIGSKVKGNDVSVADIKLESGVSQIQEHVELIKSARGSGTPLNCAQTVAESTLCAIGGRISAYTGQLVRWVDLVANQKSPYYAMQLAPSPIDFERGTVVMPAEVAAIPGKEIKFRDR